jgi:uncharacterized protein with GYD domain
MMATYVILSRFPPEAFRALGDFKRLAAEISERIKEECPEVTCKENYATLGRFDVVDIVESNNIQ